jgi:hypothetical protein
MTTQHKIAAGLALFALFGLAISLLGASPTRAIFDDQGTVSIAISSGNQLKLMDHASSLTAQKDGAGRNLACQRVIHLKVADIGLSCKPIGGVAGKSPQIVGLKVD